MNTLDDLRHALADHAPADDGLAARPAAVANRVRAVRRRRTAVGAALASVVVAGVAVAATALPSGDSPEPAPTVDPTTTATTAREAVTFAPEAGGYQLRGSMLAEPGEREFERSTVLPADVQFAVHCSTSVRVDDGPRMPWVTVEVLGWRVLQVSCGAGGAPYDDPAAFLYGPDTEDGTGFIGTRTAADGTVRERRFAADRNITFTVRLTDRDGGRYTQPLGDVELGLGIYGRP